MFSRLPKVNNLSSLHDYSLVSWLNLQAAICDRILCLLYRLPETDGAHRRFAFGDKKASDGS
jgi:hypothetical protein